METQTRGIAKSVRGMKTSEGAGVNLTRVIGTSLLRSLDPFLMLDEFASDDPKDYLAGFPDHPHRGFETVTYMVEGNFKHRDNKGHEDAIGPGGVQWMTTGRGMVHSEMPMQKEGRVQGFQLWLNLPRKDKMCEPSYGNLQASDIPETKIGDANVRVVAGTAGGITGPIGGRATEPVFLEVQLPAGGTAEVPVPEGHEGFVYPFAGNVSVGTRDLVRGELGILAPGATLRLTAKEPARVLVVAGKPLREPVVQYGPFVMSTHDEIEQAVRDYQAGKF